MSIQVQTVVNELGAKKGDFLKNVKDAVYSHIAQKSWRDCLTVTQLYSNGTVKSTWRPAATTDYFGRLLSFTRGKNYEEGGWFSSKKTYALDSGLTPGVVKVVTAEFEKFYTSDAFSNILVKQLMKDRVFVESLAKTIVEASNNPLTAAVKKQLTSRLADILENTLGGVMAKGITLGVGKIVSVMVATHVSNAVLYAMLKNMAFVLKNVLTKVLATTALKATLMSVIKKIATAKIVVIMAALLAPILGSLPVVAIAAPVAALVIAYLVDREGKKLPITMASKVSVAVSAELDGEFASLNNDIVTEMAKSLTAATFKDLAADIAKDLAKDNDFQDAINDLKTA